MNRSLTKSHWQVFSIFATETKMHFILNRMQILNLKLYVKISKRYGRAVKKKKCRRVFIIYPTLHCAFACVRTREYNYLGANQFVQTKYAVDKASRILSYDNLFCIHTCTVFFFFFTLRSTINYSFHILTQFKTFFSATKEMTCSFHPIMWKCKPYNSSLS